AVWPGAGCVVGAGVPGCTPGCGSGACVGCCCVCCCCCCCCFCCCMDGRPKKICHPISTTADSTMASSMFFWSFISSARFAPAVRRIASARRSLADGGTLTLEASQRVSEVLDHVVELPAQGGASSNQHVVVTRSQIVGRRTSDDVAEAPAHAIAFD